jgi:hypothetical protein
VERRREYASAPGRRRDGLDVRHARRRRGRARRNPTGGQWALIAAGGAAVALVTYLIFKQDAPAAPAAVLAPGPTPLPAAPTPTAPVPTPAQIVPQQQLHIAPRPVQATPAPTTTYQLTVDSDKSISLLTGQTIQFVALPGGSWTMITENHDGNVSQIGPLAVKATSPGTSIVRIAPAGPMGPTGAGYAVTISIQQDYWGGRPPVLGP